MYQNSADDYDKNAEPANQTQYKFKIMRTPRMNNHQLDCLIDYMTMHPEFAREIDLLPYSNIQDNEMWKELSAMVSIHGLARTIEQCINSWSSLKKRVFQKSSAIRKLMKRTGSSSIPPCMDLKERDLKILAIWGLSAPKFIEDDKTFSLSNNKSQLSRRRQNRTRCSRPQKKIPKSSNVHEDVAESSLKSLAELQDLDFIISQQFPTDSEILQLDNIILDNIFDRSEYSQSLELKDSSVNSFQYHEEAPEELLSLDDVFMQNDRCSFIPSVSQESECPLTRVCNQSSTHLMPGHQQETVKTQKSKKSPKVSKAIRKAPTSSKITSKAKECSSKAFRATVVANIFREENTEDTVDDEAIWEFLTSDQTNCY